MHKFQQAESLEGWKINRIIDGRTQGDFVLPRDFTIPPGRKVKVSAIANTFLSYMFYAFKSNNLMKLYQISF